MQEHGVRSFKLGNLEVDFSMANLSARAVPSGDAAAPGSFPARKARIDPKTNPLGAPYGVDDATFLRSAK